MSNCAKVQRQLFNVFNELVSDEGARKSLIQECIELQKKCNTVIDIENVSIQCESDFVKEFEVIKLKLSLTKKKCVIFGRTSSGKSTLINALLNAEVLPTDCGSTTNCFVKVKASSTDRNYLIVDNEERNIQDLEHLSNLLSDEHLVDGSHITICYDKNKCELLKDDVRIIDTPGYDSEIFDTHLMDKYFKNADIVVLVVSAISGLNEEDKKLVRTFKNTLKQLNFVIIFNFWDFVNSKYHNNIAKREKIKSQLIHKAKHILTDILDIDATLADSSIFFVSAFERVKNIAANMPCSNELNEPFTDFFNYLEMKMSESIFTKKYKHFLLLKSKMESILDKCNNLISHINKNRTNLEENIRNELKSFEGLCERISPEISKIFNQSFEKFLNKGLDLLKQNGLLKKDEPKSMDNIKSITDVIVEKSSINCQENTYQKYYELLKQIIKENYDNLKLLESSLNDDKDISQFQQNIFNEIYFQFYYNLNNKLNDIDIEKFVENLMKISKKITFCKATTVAIVGICSLLSGAIIGKIFGLESIFFVAARRIPAIKTAEGGIIGLILGVSVSFAVIECFQLQFRFAWTTEEAAIKQLWDLSLSDQSNNYSTIIDCMILNYTKLITSIERKANKIKNNLNKIEEEMETFRRNMD